MPLGPGSLDGEGVWQYGENDTETLFSDLLNLLASSTSDQFTADRVRLAAIEALSTHFASRMIVPTSVVGTGVSVSTLGKVTFTAAPSVDIRGCFPTGYDHVAMFLDITSRSAVADIRVQLTAAGIAAATNYTGVRGYDNGTARVVAAITPTTSFQPDIGGGVSKSWVDFYGPRLAAATQIGVDVKAPGYNADLSVQHSTATAYDGLLFSPASGNLTGSARFYGWNNG